MSKGTVYNKSSLEDAVSEVAEISKAEAGRQLDNVLKGIAKVVEGLKPKDKLQLVGFLTLEVVHKEAREARNPRKPEEIVQVPAQNKIKAKAGKTLIDLVQ